MDLATLQKTLAAACKGSDFSLDATAIGSAPVQALLAMVLAQPTLALSGASVNDTVDEPSVQGTLAGAPNAPYAFLADFQVVATFRLDATDTVQLHLTLTPPGSQAPTWGLPDAVPAYKNSIFAAFGWSGARFDLDSLDAATLPAGFPAQYGLPGNSMALVGALQTGMSFQADLTYTGTSAGLRWLIGGKALHAAGPIEWHGAVARMDLAAGPLTSLSLEGFTLPVSMDLVAVLNETPAAGDVPASVSSMPFSVLSGSLERQISDGSSLHIPFLVQLYQDPPRQVIVEGSFEEASHLAISEVASLLGVASLDHQQSNDFPELTGLALKTVTLVVDSERQQLLTAAACVGFTPPGGPWKPFGDVLTFDGLTVNFTVIGPFSSPSFETRVDCTATLAGGTLDAWISLPTLDFACDLDDGDTHPIDLSDVLDGLTDGAFKKASPDVKLICTALKVLGSKSQNMYRFQATVRDDWSFKALGTNFALTSVGFDISHQAGATATTTGQVVAQLIVAGVPVQIAADYEGAQQGWAFNGGTMGPEEIALSDLVDDALKLFGLSLPTSAPAVTITDLALTLNTGAMDFAFDCVGHMSVLGRPTAIGIEVSRWHDDPAHPEQATVTFKGGLKTGGVTFEADFGTGPTGTLVVFGWSQTPQATATVSLKDILADLGVDAPNGLSDIILKAASLTCDSAGQSLTVSGEVEGKGKLPLGNVSYDVDLRVVVSSAIDPTTTTRAVSAHFEADLVIGPATFAVVFNIGSVTNVVGLWRGGVGESLTPSDIAAKLGIGGAPSLPDGIDLGLKSASFTYDAAAQAFTLSAESTHFGDAFFVTARDAGGELAFVFGVDSGAGHLSSLPGIGQQLKAADVLTFQKISILVSSGSFKDFVIPTVPVLPVATAAAGQTAGSVATGRPVTPLARGSALQLSPGLSLAALIAFSGGSADPRMANLGSIVGQPTLVLQVSIGENMLRIFCALAGTVWIPAGGRNRLALSNPSVEIDITGAPPVMAVQMSGSVGFTALGMPVTATARMMISEVEAQVACVIGVDGSRMTAPVLGQLPVAKLGVEMGAFFEPPGVDLGVQGQFTIGGQARAFTVVLEMVGEAPNPLYLAFYIDKASLFDVLTMLMPQLSIAAAGASVLAPAIYDKATQALSVVQCEDLSFHWCDSVVILPDGTVAQPGLGFSAGITIFSWSGFAQMEMSAARGVSGTCEMSAIDLRGILQIAGDGAGIKRNAPPGGGAAQAAPNLQVVRSGSPAAPVWIVPPGGPIFEVDAAGPDYLHANWKITLFDAVRQSVDVTVTSTGFTFTMSFQAGSVVKFGLSCILDGKALSFSASAALALRISGSVGPIHVAGVSVGSISLPTVSVSAGLSIALTSSMFSLGLKGSFQFQSATLTIPTMSFSTAPKSVAELPGLLWQAVQQQADAIFKSVVSDVNAWADLVGRGVVTGVNDMAGTLQKAYNVSAKDATRLMSVGKQTSEAIASGLKTAYQQSDEQVATLLHDAGYSTQTITQTFKNIGVSADKTIDILQNTLHVPANEAFDDVKGTFTNTHVDVTVTPHIDTTQPPHGDANTPHGDTVQPPHGDTRSGHADTTQPPHGDTRSPHGDSNPHVDSHKLFHIDVGQHADVGGIHVDTPSVHADVGSVHADTPSVHVDVKPVHTDTPAVHIDKARVHTDTRI